MFNFYYNTYYYLLIVLVTVFMLLVYYCIVYFVFCVIFASILMDTVLDSYRIVFVSKWSSKINNANKHTIIHYETRIRHTISICSVLQPVTHVIKKLNVPVFVIQIIFEHAWLWLISATPKWH